ncbi:MULTISPECIES: hypothetical protein [Thermomonospora]|uniref:Uncharacterized protein n=1 Tax=Thermomonospora curvata (strain ATCC 19995 / DSM 43183 / JCM 3096 / KCTC 9072 / NBRC 15933 / NCIMB 10081 / Henssen B9) TaxID=471852 RepID=D1A617_THECD|nr:MULTISPECIES: hypothetical protein [Thermomonospora]ACY98312.1 hypothetical protein Tcur_2766 [Thermomonospora curvata DSM 43183]
MSEVLREIDSLLPAEASETVELSIHRLDGSVDGEQMVMPSARCCRALIDGE